MLRKYLCPAWSLAHEKVPKYKQWVRSNTASQTWFALAKGHIEQWDTKGSLWTLDFGFF